MKNPIIEQLFWCEATGFYAYALDGDKKQVQTIASNPGHLLWSDAEQVNFLYGYGPATPTQKL
jgi:hypothetical protein